VTQATKLKPHSQVDRQTHYLVGRVATGHANRRDVAATVHAPDGSKIKVLDRTVHERALDAVKNKTDKKTK